MRVISLVPSITETLFDLGMDESQIVGRTKFCLHPAPIVKQIPQMGGTKNPHLYPIIKAKPDLVILNREENRKDDAELLAEHLKILVTEVKDFRSNVNLLKVLGKELEVKEMADLLISQIHEAKSCLPFFSPLPAAYLIWKKPWMTVGSDTYIHSMMETAGFQNIFGNTKRYPTVSLKDLAPAEVILLSSEPYPFKPADVEELQHIFPEKSIMLVDGEMFSWFGSRARQAFPYLQKLRSELQP